MRLFRASLQSILPRWLVDTYAWRTVYAIGVHFDLIADMAVAAVKRRFANAAPYDQLSELAKDRKLRRAPGEAPQHFANRIHGAYDAHAYSGGPYALLEELRRFIGDIAAFQAVLIYRSGRKFTMDTAGDIVMGDQADFDPDEDPQLWARWWLFVYPETEPNIGEEDYRAMLRDFNAAHCDGWGEAYILLPGEHVWGEPDLYWGEPDLYWGSGLSTRIIEDI